MADVEVKWYGDEVLKEILSASEEGMFAGAEELLRAATARAPKGATGNLKASGYVASEKRSTYRSKKGVYRAQVKTPAGAVAVAFAAFYATFVEYGTGKAAAHPFLRPVVDELRGQIGRKIAAVMREDLK